MNEALKISTFKDISAFILETLQKRYQADIEIKYVKNANESHQDLIDKRADIVFMSYDDTLSIYFEKKFHDIRAFMPIHGGILDLCGNINFKLNQVNIGIDTDSGYARALRTYLKTTLSTQDYNQLKWLKSGATNIRYKKLINGQLDATLLNPPFCVMPNVNCLTNLYKHLGEYQGLIANTRQKWFIKNQSRVNKFITIYHELLASILNNAEQTIDQIKQFYAISQDTAQKIYARLLESDGLNFSKDFNNRLKNTEKIFCSEMKNVYIPEKRDWIITYDIVS